MKKNILEEYRATKNKGEDFYIGYWLEIEYLWKSSYRDYIMAVVVKIRIQSSIHGELSKSNSINYNYLLAG